MFKHDFTRKSQLFLNRLYYNQKLHVTEKMKERVSKLTYPTLQHCLRMMYSMKGNAMH